MSDKPTEREPLLSDKEMEAQGMEYEGNLVRKWYESKITSGDLRVVKKVEVFQAPAFIGTFEGIGCHGCGRSYPKIDAPSFNFCPVCGDEIEYGRGITPPTAASSE